MERDTERILNGEEPLPPNTSRNYIGGLPEKFTKWLDKNEERIANAKSLPYFLKDNQGLINGATGVAILAGASTTTTTTITTPTTTTANAGVAQPTANPTPATQQGNTDILKLSDSVPDWTFKGENTKDSLWARVKYFDESLERCYGKNLELLDDYDNVTREKWMNAIRDIVNKGFTGVSQSDYGYAKSVFGYMQGTGKCVANSINHLQTLRSVKKDDVPERWRTAYNNAIKELNAYDYSKGYFGVYTKIEKAYNIYKLAGLPEVQSLGYENVSVNTPYNLFTEYKTAIPDLMDKLPPKEFFDMLKDFVPLVKCGGDRACHIGAFKTVYVPVDERHKVVLKQTLVHEYGHAYDQQMGMSKKQNVRDAYDKWENKMRGTAGETRKTKINDEMTLFKNRVSSLGVEERRRVTTLFEEDLGALTDLLGAARKEELLPRFHSWKKYFSPDREKVYKEFVAHCMEAYWSDLDYFKKHQPLLYKEMRRFVWEYR